MALQLSKSAVCQPSTPMPVLKHLLTAKPPAQKVSAVQPLMPSLSLVRLDGIMTGLKSNVCHVLQAATAKIQQQRRLSLARLPGLQPSPPISTKSRQATTGSPPRRSQSSAAPAPTGIRQRSCAPPAQKAASVQSMAVASSAVLRWPAQLDSSLTRLACPPAKFALQATDARPPQPAPRPAATASSPSAASSPARSAQQAMSA